MTKIVSFHSFRRGTGRTSLLTSLAVILARKGNTVGVIDTNLQSPSAHILFQLPNEAITCTLDNFLWNECPLDQAIYDVGDKVDLPGGCLYLIPSSDNMARIMRVLKDGLDIGVLTKAFSDFADLRSLDYLFLDSSSGVTEDILLAMSVADILAIVMRLDEQDYQGVSVTLDLARRLDLARSMLIVNHVPPNYDLEQVATQVKEGFNNEVGAVFPHVDEYLTLASSGIFAHKYPQHPFTYLLEDLAGKL